MCFKEFIAYTCGHSSTPINRPCPMTTHLHTNPCCPGPAVRPFLSEGMCPACSRILHGRYFDILDIEHRWMHERGACNCGTVFPYLQQPRQVTRANDQTSSTNQGLAADIAPPLYKETEVDSTLQVSLRLSSLYAAEWTKDHAKHHENGKCKCPVSFAKYEPQTMKEFGDEIKYGHHEKGAGDEVKHGHHEKAPSTNTLPMPKGKGKNKGSKKKANLRSALPLYPQQTPIATAPFLSTAGSGNQDYYKAGFHPNQFGHNTYDPNNNTTTTTTPAGPSTRLKSETHRSEQNTTSPEFPHNKPAIGTPARWTCSPPDLRPLDMILGPINPSPVDLQTTQLMHLPQETLIVGAPLAVIAEAKSEIPSMVQFQPLDTPIAGFPVGAGPEGESHAGSFDECELSLSALSLELGSEGCELSALSLETLESDEPPVRKRRYSSEL
ncbi:Uu.00g040660.m01.CDS01 [Anthostomella pinea]|uniref:Uu.00g040660.m01.CDS01 n=1 Tax=Anthostomella pinea TaxID=933095 RepID=A0AAI8YE33_9PEZI|nr:Uu.00g040660.m01.CDS01 [Anthostomella pinea]